MKFSLAILAFFTVSLSASNNLNSDKLLNLAGFASSQSENLEVKGFGTGFAITSDGYLISASHVTEGCDTIKVIFKNGEPLDAKVVREEPKLDLTVLKIDAPTPSFLNVTSRTSGLGEDIYTIGYPSPELLGLNQKFTKGSISALSGLLDDSFRYQISIPIQPGNSGGPVVCDETGEVVGIVVASLKGKDIVGFNPQNVNYALKSSFIKPILDSLEISTGTVSKTLGNKAQMRQKAISSTCMIITFSAKGQIHNSTKLEVISRSKPDTQDTPPIPSSYLFELHQWTDIKGRTISAKFIKYENGVLHLNWNGHPFPLKITTLNSESVKLAEELSSLK